nr:class I SAM-dependent methyltransferase [Pseudoxanthomonas sp.]
MSIRSTGSHGGHARKPAWTDYWRTGALHSCPTSYPGNYDGAIGEFWREAAQQLPQGGRILDVATGNGAVPRLLMSHGRLDLDIDGIDAADVSGIDAAMDARIRFHSGIRMEALPFSAGQFDAASSQFGIEYANHPEALEEVLRVLKPSGQIHWVMHHRDSVFTRMAAHESEHLAWATGTEGILDAAIAIAPWMLRIRTDPALKVPLQANVARNRFNQVQIALEQRIRLDHAGAVLQEIRATAHAILLQDSDPVPTLMRYRRELEFALLRCQDLCACACDQTRLLNVAGWLGSKRPALQVEITTLSQAEGLLAWGLRAIPS